MKILVITGTQRFQFNRLIKAVDDLDAPERILADADVVCQSGSSTYKPVNIELTPFMNHEQMVKCMNDSDLIITHGGTGSIIEAISMNKKVIAVSRLAKYKEHVDDHQKEIVSTFDEAGYIIGINDTDELEQAIMKSINFQPVKWVSRREPMLKGIKEVLESYR